MARQSAGLLIYRQVSGDVEVFLVHPGGPFWQNKDLGAWSIPKGEFAAGDDPLEAAQREFQEEIGLKASGPFVPLRPVKQRGGKVVHAWLCESDFDAERVKSNTFAMEWPRGSGESKHFPEIDRAQWFTLEAAREKILASQQPLLDQLASLLKT
ncbi:MAG: NUDIX domain-containing protein [Planctomycetes bacterium]|nr:NUDIX domain-containing protein [Planctomycetota bacterium]